MPARAMVAPYFEEKAKSPRELFNDADKNSDGYLGEAELRNDEPTWESTVGEIVGPGRESFAIVAALGSKSFSIDTPPQRVVTSLPPRRGGGRGVVLRVGRTPASAPAAWAALVVATEDVAPKVWRLE